tara:strand:- start:991 stop:1263 length:273 start_codon:yes stop_codon:yes gene_type:complete
MSNFKIYIIILLIFSNISLSFGIVWVEYKTRSKFRELQEYTNKIETYKNEWKKLSVEEGKYIAHRRIENEAKKHLNMILPKNKELIKIYD